MAERRAYELERLDRELEWRREVEEGVDRFLARPVEDIVDSFFEGRSRSRRGCVDCAAWGEDCGEHF
jgi:hypothetical protein